MHINRRQFIDATAIAAAVTVVPHHVIGRPNQVAPGNKINIGYVGCGTQGIRQLMPALERSDVRIVAVCDPNRGSDDYPEWSEQELNNKVRKFLDDPDWAKGARGGLCGREVVQEIVNRHYGKQKRSRKSSDCRAYADFREMLEKEKDLDAVYIMTPDHLHGTVAIHAMRQHKHVIVHKPIANVLYETRLARDTARETGVATHLFCSAGQTSTPTLCEWIWGGAIGPIREVHNWSKRPVWPQGMTERPSDTPPVPDGLDWDLWLGPVPHRPYHPAYTHAVFRGWYDFGTGALGDMGHYSFYQIFRILKLGIPLSVEASRSQYWSIRDYAWRKEINTVSFPRASVIHWQFPAREDMPPVTLHWYDGGIRPPIPEELEADGEPMPEEGLLFVGDQGKILADFMGDKPRLIPKARMSAFSPPPETLPRPIGEFDQWLRACKGGQASDASFENVYPFAETILLGLVALRIDKKLTWDSEKMEFPGEEEANRLLYREYREGWEL
ncbi:MAG TPA: Gfo/Idh/MocA family oxidoreductase [bacterium]|nr:Gfo/Idh/MocA family oxidoreductase [bacterium]HQO33652.1 Gfo/Idh/MocA family oxidoreductase [bacterium]